MRNQNCNYKVRKMTVTFIEIQMQFKMRSFARFDVLFKRELAKRFGKMQPVRTGIKSMKS